MILAAAKPLPGRLISVGDVEGTRFYRRSEDRAREGFLALWPSSLHQLLDLRERIVRLFEDRHFRPIVLPLKDIPDASKILE